MRQWKVFFKNEILIVAAHFCEINMTDNQVRFFYNRSPGFESELIAFFDLKYISGLYEITDPNAKVELDLDFLKGVD